MLPFFILGFAKAVGAASLIVTVGKGGPSYEPNNIVAHIGAVVSFRFVAGEHSVSQSGDNPCEPLFGGFDSGVVSAANGTQVWNVTIEDTRPIWFYCRQANHCQQGMAGVINAGTPWGIDSYVNSSKSYTGPPQHSELRLHGIGARTDAHVVIRGRIDIASYPTPGPTDTASHGPTKPVVVAVVVPLAALILAAGVGILLLRQRRRRRNRAPGRPSAGGVVAYAVPTWAGQAAPATQPSNLKPEMYARWTKAEGGRAGVEELHAATQRAGISVQTLLAAERDGSPPQYEA